MKKNLISLGLILGIFLIGFVSASISGYLVRGTAISDGGYTATLQKVTDGIATIAVRTPEGATEFVRVAEGEKVKVGDAEISASSLKKGTLFKRGGAEISVIPVEAKSCSCYVYVGANPQEVTAEVGQKIYTLDNSGHFTSSYFYGEDEMPTELDISNGLWAQSMNCERLTESLAGSGKQVYNMEQTLNILNDIERPVPFYSKECMGIPASSEASPVAKIATGTESEETLESGGDTKGHTHLVDYKYVTEKLNLKTQTKVYNEFTGKIDCVGFGKNYVVLGGGYILSPKVNAGYIIETNGPESNHVYSVELRDYNIQYQNLTGNIFATCARLENAIGTKEPHF